MQTFTRRTDTLDPPVLLGAAGAPTQLEKVGRYTDVDGRGRRGAAARMALAGVSLLLRTVGQASDGIRGYRHGFDSGPMLDYVYDNRARGRFGMAAGRPPCTRIASAGGRFARVRRSCRQLCGRDRRATAPRVDRPCCSTWPLAQALLAGVSRRIAAGAEVASSEQTDLVS